MIWLDYLAGHPGYVARLTATHAGLSALGTALGAAVAVPCGIWAHRRERLCQLAAALAEIIQTIPSLALMAVLMMALGLGDRTLVATLVLYALLPLFHNTVEGLRAVDPALVDVARGLGMAQAQVLWRVQLPLALPVLLAGLRVALVTSIGIATIGVFIGAGGLGRLIYEGMQVMDPARIVAGVLAAAGLAVAADLLLTLLAGRAATGRIGRRGRPRPTGFAVAVAGPPAGHGPAGPSGGPRRGSERSRPRPAPGAPWTP